MSTVRVTVPEVNVAAWRLVAGAERCESCGTFVAPVNGWGEVEVRETAPGEPPLAPGRYVAEFELVGELGWEHTPQRCRDAR